MCTGVTQEIVQIQLNFAVQSCSAYLRECMRNVGVLLRQAAHVGSRARYMAAHVTPRAMASQRGAFIVFEGGDRCGKTTQSHNLVEHLTSSGVRSLNAYYHCPCKPPQPSPVQIKAELWKFPDRQTSTGVLIDSYLNSKEELDDAAVHLLYSANRWEKRQASATCSQKSCCSICIET